MSITVYKLVITQFSGITGNIREVETFCFTNPDEAIKTKNYLHDQFNQDSFIETSILLDSFEEFDQLIKSRG